MIWDVDVGGFTWEEDAMPRAPMSALSKVRSRAAWHMARVGRSTLALRKAEKILL
jgi:hypothetical protein